MGGRGNGACPEEASAREGTGRISNRCYRARQMRRRSLTSRGFSLFNVVHTRYFSSRYSLNYFITIFVKFQYAIFVIELKRDVRSESFSTIIFDIFGEIINDHGKKRLKGIEGRVCDRIVKICRSRFVSGRVLSMLRRDPFAYQEERSSKERHAYLTKSGLRILMAVLRELYGRTSRRSNRRSFQIRALRDPDESFGI